MELQRTTKKKTKNRQNKRASHLFRIEVPVAGRRRRRCGRRRGGRSDAGRRRRRRRRRRRASVAVPAGVGAASMFIKYCMYGMY